MNKSLYSFAFLLCVIFLGSCTSLHRGIPRGERHHRIEREPATEQTVVVLPDENIQETPVETLATTQEPKAPTEITVDEQRPVVLAEERLPAVSDDTTFVETVNEDEIIYQAMESERLAKNAYIFSWLPIGWLFFLPLLLIGIIGTIVCLNKFRSYEYVTEQGLEYKRKATRNVIVTSLLGILVPIILLLIIVLVALLLL